MESFFVVVVIVVVFLVGRAITRSIQSGPVARQQTRHTAHTSPSIPTHTYKPRAESRPKIKFRPQVPESIPTASGRTIPDLSGLRDALTGTPLDSSRGLYRCQCEVFYHADSFELLRQENSGCCVACHRASSIVSISSAQAKQQSGRNYEAGITTLADYQSKVGQVVVFEGHCVRVLPSRRGSDYAVMFEDKSWTRGFKMVCFRGATARVGGPAFLLSLAGKQIRVRGLIVKHPRFGYEIIVSDKAMILEVR
jgi:hypothetical protein